MSHDPVARAHRWHNFMTEEGGINDALDGIRKSYFEKYKLLDIKDDAGRRNLALADKIVEQLQSHIQDIITSGNVAKANEAHAERVAKTGKKRW